MTDPPHFYSHVIHLSSTTITSKAQLTHDRLHDGGRTGRRVFRNRNQLLHVALVLRGAYGQRVPEVHWAGDSILAQEFQAAEFA